MHDFKFELTVLHGTEGVNLLGFRRKLPNPHEFTPEQSDEKIEEILNLMYQGKTMNIDYTKNQNGHDVINMISEPEPNNN